MEINSQSKYYVVFFEVDKQYKTIQDVMAKFPKEISEHITRSIALHKKGKVVMAGSFLNTTEEGLRTMGVFYTKEDAEEFAKGDPFVLNGLVTRWYLREWTNILTLVQ